LYLIPSTGLLFLSSSSPVYSAKASISRPPETSRRRRPPVNRQLEWEHLPTRSGTCSAAIDAAKPGASNCRIRLPVSSKVQPRCGPVWWSFPVPCIAYTARGHESAVSSSLAALVSFASETNCWEQLDLTRRYRCHLIIHRPWCTDRFLAPKRPWLSATDQTGQVRIDRWVKWWWY
jgi:hypothetical protein